jgi:hypothetical protein
MTSTQEIEEIKKEMMDELKTIQVLPEIMDNLEESKSNTALIEFIIKFQKIILQKTSQNSESNEDNLKLSQAKMNFKNYLKIILNNVWEQKMLNHIKTFEIKNEQQNEEDFHFVQSKDREKDTEYFSFKITDLDFHQRQKLRLKRNILSWKKKNEKNN